MLAGVPGWQASLLDGVKLGYAPIYGSKRFDEAPFCEAFLFFPLWPYSDKHEDIMLSGREQIKHVAVQ